MDLLHTYPVAVASAIATYVLFIAMAWPQTGPGANRWTGQNLRNLLAHPVKPSQTYLPGFDALRGFSALLVAAGHLWWFTNQATYPAQQLVQQLAYSAKAVPMFVMLSGFLIYRSVLNIHDAGSIKVYFWRRFFRIYPAYLVSVFMTVVMFQLSTGQQGYGALTLFISEFFAMRAFGATIFVNPVAWSLYVEMIFYMVLPGFVALIGRKAMVTACLIGFVAFTIGDNDISRELSLVKFFFVGVMVSELALRDRERVDAGATPLLSRPWLIAMLVLGTIWLWFDLRGRIFDVFGNLIPALKSGDHYSIGLAICFSMIMLSLARLPHVAKHLDSFGLRFLGVISYSVFLVHPFYIIANFPGLQLVIFQTQHDTWASWTTMPAWFFFLVYLPGVLIWGALAFLIVERPAMRWGNIWIAKKRETWGTSAIAGHAPSTSRPSS